MRSDLVPQQAIADAAGLLPRSVKQPGGTTSGQMRGRDLGRFSCVPQNLFAVKGESNFYRNLIRSTGRRD